MCNPIRRHLKLTCQLRRAHLKCLELLGEMLAGMKCLTRHKAPLLSGLPLPRASAGHLPLSAIQSRFATDHSLGCCIAPFDRLSMPLDDCQANQDLAKTLQHPTDPVSCRACGRFHQMA